MDKTSFVLHYDSLEVIEHLSDEQVWKLLRKMRSYHNGNTYVSDDSLVDIAFCSFKNQFDRDKEKFNNVCERNALNWAKWGRPKTNPENPVGNLGTQNNPDKPRKAESEKESDSESDKENNKNKKKNEIQEFYKESKEIPVDERTVTQHLVVCFSELWFIGKKDETIDQLRDWIKWISELKWKTWDELKETISLWYSYWIDQKKPVKNHKTSLMNHYSLNPKKNGK